ncbi:MAG: LUD domain-containing protein [Halodesulfurarchaeum sp.]
MSGKSRREIAAKIRDVLDAEGGALNDQITHHNEQHYAAIDDFEAYEQYRSAARQVKEAAIENLPTLIETVTEQVEANGGQVYLADDRVAANRYVNDVLEGLDGETVVKSKSMTTEEIGLREHLESENAAVYETDLGEFVVQLADESPSHIVGPALHKSRAEIASLFNDTFELDQPLETPGELTAFAREYLGDRINNAALGITGANFVMAESGTIALVTNEGNARKSAVVPDTHVAVAGVEKLIPSISDLHPFIELIARAATGQDISQYVSLLTPPVETPTLDFENPDADIGSGEGDREFHLVLLDNGRFSMREDPQLRETLYCIRCGACLNSCANFQHVGGHAFGGDTYSGGIGTGWVAGISGTDATADFNDICTSCSRCVENCPVKIDIPWINTVVRNRRNRGRAPAAVDHLIDPLLPDEESARLDLQKRFFGNIGSVLELGSRFAPFSNWALSLPGLDRFLEATIGLDRRRSVPEFAPQTFADWWAKRGGSQVSDPTGSVILFTDLYTNYLDPSRGRATVRVLEALDYTVRITKPIGSARAPLSQGMIATAEKQAREVVSVFEPALEEGTPIVVVEPSDLALFRSDYSKLLSDIDSDRVRDATVEVFEFLEPRLRTSVEPDQVSAGSVRFHSNCQQRSVGLEGPTVRTFEALGYDISTTDVECCGMAGSFGYKSQFYELSMAVGEDLRPQVTVGSETEVSASGTSCVAQIDSLGDEKRPVHPIEIIDRDWMESNAGYRLSR